MGKTWKGRALRMWYGEQSHLSREGGSGVEWWSMYKGAEVGPFRVLGVKGRAGQGRAGGCTMGINAESPL